MEQAALPQEISDVVSGIVTKFRPKKIYLFSSKRGTGGDTASFKLCVVMDCESRDTTQREIYRRIDSEIPYDVILYTPAEWQELTARKGSFAQKIYRTGALLHE